MNELTVCIPAYHAAGTIDETLKSLEIQTDKRFNVLIIANGLPDEENDAMWQLILPYVTSHEDWEAVRIDDNIGCAKARNIGLDKCKTRYIAYLDADDMYYPTAVAEMTFGILKHFDYFAGKFTMETVNGLMIYGSNHNTWCHGRVYDREFLKFHNIRFPEELSICDDTPFNVLCAEFGVEVRESSLPVAYYRMNDKSITKQDGAKLKQAEEYITGNIYYARTALRQRQADKLLMLPQVIAMSYFYADYAAFKGYECSDDMRKQFSLLAEQVDLYSLLEDEKWVRRLNKELLNPMRPYPDLPEIPHQTFSQFVVSCMTA